MPIIGALSAVSTALVWLNWKTVGLLWLIAVYTAILAIIAATHWDDKPK